MIFVVEFLEDSGIVTSEPVRCDLELLDEVALVQWLARCGRTAYVHRLFDPYGSLWTPTGRQQPEGAHVD
jgi:hypothetical protein